MACRNLNLRRTPTGRPSRHVRYAIVSAFVCSLASIDCHAALQTETETESSGLTNGSFEELDEAGQPSAWFFPAALREAGYQQTMDTTDQLTGKQSALIDATGVKQVGNSFGNLMQIVDAEPFRGFYSTRRAGGRSICGAFLGVLAARPGKPIMSRSE